MARRERIDHYMTQNIKKSSVYSTTKKVYAQQVRQLLNYMRETGQKTSMHVDQMLPASQQYVQHLQEIGQSSHSVHTAISALAKGLGVKMADIGKVDRTLSAKGRDAPGLRTRYNQRICDFASMVGIRRAEYAALTGKDILEKDGKTYVVVRKGKGGKYQEQLVSDKNAEAVKSYFKGKGPDEKIFSSKEVKGLEHANVHALRRKNAQEMYRYYEKMNPAERKEVIKKLQERFDANKKKAGKLDVGSLYRPYYVRSPELIRSLAANGFDRKLDRFALMSVAVFHLSHYRVDVVVKNYLR